MEKGKKVNTTAKKSENRQEWKEARRNEKHEIVH